MKLSKLKLRDSRELGYSEMKHIMGGTLFYCYCDSYGAKAPYTKSWDADYSTMREMNYYLDMRCVKGGTCNYK